MIRIPHVGSILGRLRLSRNPTQSQFTFKQSAGFESDPTKAIIFINNRFPDAFRQIESYLNSGFLSQDTCRLVFRRDVANYKNILNACRRYGLEWYAFETNSDLPKVFNAIVLYPYNNASNTAFVDNRTCIHVLLMHGDSHKTACVKPLARLYDHVLVAGDIAVDRYIEHGIFSIEDLYSGRLIRMGIDCLGNLKELKAASGKSGAIAYLPTWEGSHADENYSSLHHDAAAVADLLLRAMDQTGVNEIVIRLHPHFGLRLFYLKDAMISLLRKLELADAKITFWVGETYTNLEKTLTALFEDAAVISDRKMLPPFRLAISDISAMEALFLAAHIPTVSLHLPTQVMSLPRGYSEGMVHRIVKLGSGEPSNDIMAEWQASDLVYLEKLVRYEQPEISAWSPSERFKWLSERLKSTLSS